MGFPYLDISPSIFKIVIGPNFCLKEVCHKNIEFFWKIWYFLFSGIQDSGIFYTFSTIVANHYFFNMPYFLWQIILLKSPKIIIKIHHIHVHEKYDKNNHTQSEIGFWYVYFIKININHPVLRQCWQITSF